jgi:large subunit ribosomal protein L24
MASLHVKKNDEVVVIAGAFRDKRSRIIAVDGKSKRALVEGLHIIKKHMRKSQQYPQGKIVEREGPIHISNLMKAAEFDARAAKRKATETTPV